MSALDPTTGTIPRRRSFLLSALTGTMEIIAGTAPQLRTSSTWEPRPAYAQGSRPERKHHELHVWQGERGGPVAHVTAFHVDPNSDAGPPAKAMEIHLEARLEPVPGTGEEGKLIGRARLGDDLGPFVEALIAGTAPGAGRAR